MPWLCSIFTQKKVDFIYQEIFAKLTKYNFCQMITQSVAIRKGKRKYSHPPFCHTIFSANTNNPACGILGV